MFDPFEEEKCILDGNIKIDLEKRWQGSIMTIQ